MDPWQVAQNYGIFLGLVGGATVYYYYTNQQRRPNQARLQSFAPASKKTGENETRLKKSRRTSPDRAGTGSDTVAPQKAGESKRRRVQDKQPVQAEQVDPTVIQDEKPAKESDISNAQFAQMMAQARSGHQLAVPKSKGGRTRTVKQSSAKDTPVSPASSSQAGPEAGAEVEDDVSPPLSPAVNTGDVSDMLEPVSSGPSTLRIGTPSRPQKERVARQPKEEVAESKKARQNRKKVEERRLQREAEENERKALEERQRRTAREARGEPAKNGISIPKTPTSSAWAAQAANRAAEAAVAAATNGHNAPLLDTFEAGSTSSSNGALEPDTAATSTTDGETAQWDRPESDEVGAAVKQSNDESGWATVTATKKGKKKATDDADATSGAVKPPATSSKYDLSAKPVVNRKPNGYGELKVEELINWDA